MVYILTSIIRHVRLSYYRPGQAVRAPVGLVLPEFVDSRLMNVVRLSALRTGHLFPHLVFISVSDRVDPRVTVRPEGLRK